MNWLVNQFKGAIIAKYLASTIRHLISAAAGLLVGIGADPSIVSEWKSSNEALIGAVVAWLISYVWSLLEKKKNG